MIRTKPTTALMDLDRLTYAVAFMVEGKDEPEANILNSAKLMLEASKREITELAPTVTKFKLFLSHEKNFRKEIAQEHIYKGNRGEKPEAIGLIRDYFKGRGAFTYPHMEADDLTSISHWKSHRDGSHDTLIYDIDKDLDMVPGWRVRPSLKQKGFIKREATIEFITPEEAMRSFYRQLLTGDSIDNIGGLKGVGKKVADKVIGDSTKPQELFTKVLDKYLEELNGSCYSEVMRLIFERGNLLWMKRFPGDVWIPPAQHED